MIEVQQIADFLDTELNNIGKSQGYNFDIKAEVGKRTNEDAIYGIVSTTKAEARVDENVDYVFTVELSVPSAQSNENVINVEKIIGEFKNKFHMKNRAFGGGQGTLSISLAMPKDYQIKYVVGDDVPLVFTISTIFIRNGVGSGDKHWLLNGMEIPFINESVSVQKEGRTNTIHGESYTKTLLTRQTRYYKFGFDYDNSELCIMLKKDLLDGKYDKVYTLTYYDGVSFTEEQPFTTSVSIFVNGQSSSTKPNVSEFDITFTDVDNEEEAQYFMALIDNPFDSTTENTRYFSSQEEQKAYYQDKIDNDIRVGGVGCQFVKIKAPNLSSVVITNQVYEIPLHEEQPIYDVFSAANKNYAIIKVKKGEDEQWFYYYVSNQNIGGQNQVMFDLKIDSIQTYYFNPELQFGECLIEKGHLNRWIDNGDGTVSFDGTVDSKLFEREDIQNVAKRLTKRTRIGVNNHNQPELDNWLNENVICWLYVYLDPTHSFKILDPKTHSQREEKFTNISYNSKGIDVGDYASGIPSNISCICVPIYNGNGYIEIKFLEGPEGEPEVVRIFSKYALEKFLSLNSGTDDAGYKYVYATKISFMPPFYNNNIDYEMNGDRLVLKSSVTGIQPLSFFSGDTLWGDVFASVNGQKSEILAQNYSVENEFTFAKDEIIGKHKNSKFNPKLLSQDYKELKLSDNTGDGFIYDIQKLNRNLLEIIVTEPFVPDITKRYIRIKNKDGIYIEDTNENLTGFINSNDTSIVMPTSAYQSMLAQNKNYFLQNDINRKFNLGQGLISSGLAIAGGISSGNPLSIVGGGIGAINTGLNFAKSKINENLTIDNLKNAPGSIVGAKGNAVFESMYSRMGIFIEEWDILPNEKEIVNDYMCKYGFTVNRFGNPKEYDNIRHYYNFVKAQIDSISGVAISNAARDDLRQRFSNGVRFWKQDDIDYSMENYEEWLTQIEEKAKISWGVSPLDKYTVVAEYNQEEFTSEFIAEKSGTFYLKCGQYLSINLDNIESDGIVETSKTNSYTLSVTFTNATYVKVNVVVRESV